MLDSSKQPSKSQVFIIVIWLVFTFLAFSYFINNNLVFFDKNNKLKGINNQDFAMHLTKFTPDLLNNSTGTIIHFSNGSCHCNQLSDKHIGEIDQLAQVNNFNVLSVNVQIDNFIPSTPSIAILDNVGELIYFGPYGDGLSCSNTTGFAKTVLKNHIKGYSANLILNNAKGCYCPV